MTDGHFFAWGFLGMLAVGATVAGALAEQVVAGTAVGVLLLVAATWVALDYRDRVEEADAR